MLIEPISATQFVRLCRGIYPTDALVDWLRESVHFRGMLASPEFWLDDLGDYLDDPEPEPRRKPQQES